MKKSYTLFAGLILLLVSYSANAQCTGGRYHSLVFPGSPTVTSDIVYGSNTNYLGAPESLKLDIYRPACDTAIYRPLIVFAHGGSFMTGDKADAGYAATAIALAKLGYVVASINYRLGFPTSGLDAAYGFNSAIMRGVHDARAAIRFLRNNALNGGNTYGIDPNNIFFGGVSAGGIMALHLAYQNTQGEQNMSCNNQPGSECGSIEGTSNGPGSPLNTTISSSVRAIISISGGIRDLSWITTNDVPVYMAHGTIDGTVPYGSGTFGGFFTVHGSSSIAQRCVTTGTKYCFTPMIGQDHTPANTAYADTLATVMRSFLEHFMCNITLNCAYNGSPAVLTPSVSIAVTSGTNPTCTGTPLTFTATASNGGTNLSYQWKKNGTNVGTGTTYTLSSPANNDVITCVLTTCVGSPATSNAVTVTVNSATAPTVAIAVTSGSNPTCAGAAITFTATPTNGGNAPTYQWKKNGTNVGTGSLYTLASPANNDIITCVMTSSSSCANPTTATSNAITVTITSSVVPSVGIAVTSGSNPTCAGAAITFTATPTNGGGAPTYQWKKNGTNVGTGATYTLSSPANNDIITCVMTSSSACANPTTATSSGITVTVSATVTPTVSIAVSSGSNPTCTGASVTFAATPTNGGGSPSYQWKKNGTNSGTGTTYALPSPANNDVITCVMTSSSSCANPTTATSNSVTMTVNVLPTISKNGNALTSSSASGNQWYLNGQLIAGATNQTYTATASGNYTVKSGLCTSVAMSVTVTDVKELSESNLSFTVYPNPSDGNFNLSFASEVKASYMLNIQNVTGVLVYRETLNDFSEAYSRQIDMTDFGKGIYFINLHSPKDVLTKKIFVY